MSAAPSSPRVLLSGYYGFGNAGDEAVCAAIAQTLHTHGGDPKLTVLSSDPTATQRDHGIRAVRRKDLFRALPDADALFQGGGSLLQDATSARSVYYYLYVILAARIIRRPVFLYAQGIGPLMRPTSRAAVRAVLNRVQGITVRDSGSRALLESLGVSKPPVYVTADPVWALEPAPKERARLIWERQGLPTDGTSVGLALRTWPGSDVAGIGAGIAEGLRERGLTPVLLPMQRPEDEVLARRISEGSDPPVLCLQGAYHPAEIMAFTRECTFVIGMRLHALIFAAAVGTPVMGLSYDPKVTALLDDLRAPGMPLPKTPYVGIPSPPDIALVGSGNILEGFDAAWADRDLARQNLKGEALRLRDAALSNARIARRFLADKV